MTIQAPPQDDHRTKYVLIVPPDYNEDDEASNCIGGSEDNVIAFDDHRPKNSDDAEPPGEQKERAPALASVKGSTGGPHENEDQKKNTTIGTPDKVDPNSTANNANADKGASPRNRFHVLLPSEMRELPEPSWLVKECIPARSVVVLYGRPGSYKTFLELEILLSAATGRLCFGALPVVQGAAILCSAEGATSIAKKRLPAWAEARGIHDIDNIPFGLVQTVPLASKPADLVELSNAIKSTALKPAIIAIDTVARAMSGLDENSAKDMNFLVSAAEHLQREFECTVLLVHHTGKDEGRGPRGSNALLGGVETVLGVEANARDHSVILRCTRMKDADLPIPIFLKGRPVAGSLVFDQIDGPQRDAMRASPDRVSPQAVYDALNNLGCVSLAEKCPTQRLAAEILRTRGELPQDDAGTFRAIRNLRNRLLEAWREGGPIAVYGHKDGTRQTSGVHWWVPEDEHEANVA